MANKNVKGAETNEALNQSEALFLKYKNQIIIGVCAVILLIGGCFAYNAYVAQPREDKASTIIARGQEYFGAEQFDKALNGDGAGFIGFVKAASDYSGTDAGNLANLYAGLCYANLDKWDEAVKYLSEYDGADDAMVSPAALAALGNAYAHVGKIDEAISTLTKAADKADKAMREGINNSIAPTFRLQAAELLESQNKNDEALEMYKDIKAKYVNSALVQSQEIDKYIERLNQK